jgi:hypothetical protein
MQIIIEQKTSWKDVLNNARATIKKDCVDKEPSNKWKYRMLMCEHSPIRTLHYSIQMIGIPYWVSVHFSRHNHGVEHFVSTQRTDRTGTDRSELNQSQLVNHTMYLNAQAIINISRKRLCMQASKETREVWYAVLDELSYFDKQLADICVRDCIYRGYCYEIKPCGYSESYAFVNELDDYRFLLKGEQHD